MGPFVKQSFVVLGAALNILGHGCAHGFPAVLFAQLETSDGINLTDHDISWIASTAGIMGIVGNFVSPLLMSRFGRQKAHLITTIPALLGWIVFVAGDSVPYFLVARLLHGLALGLRTPLAAILVAEYTEPKYRGVFLGTFAITLGAGIMLAHLWGGFLSWRITAGICGLFPMAAMAIIALSPESPSWLVSKNRINESRKSFKWLRGDGEQQKQELESMIKAQQHSVKRDQKGEYEITEQTTFKDAVKVSVRTSLDSIKSFSHIAKKRSFYKPTLVAISMLIVFEFGGAHTFASYGNKILRRVLDKSDPSEVNLHFTVLDLLRTVSAFLAIFLLKAFRRRAILFTSGILTVLSMSAISVCIYLREAKMIDGYHVNIISMCLMVFYTLAFCLGVVPLNWVICGEVFPMRYRSLGSTISTSFLTPAFLISMKTAPHLYSAIGVEGSFLLYSAILTLFLFIIYVLLPETKDKTLQEIEDSFVGKNKRDLESELHLMENK